MEKPSKDSLGAQSVAPEAQTKDLGLTLRETMGVSSVQLSSAAAKEGCSHGHGHVYHYGSGNAVTSPTWCAVRLPDDCQWQRAWLPLHQSGVCISSWVGSDGCGHN